jgi:Na+-transporting NADH:ubiquinone oxidoreductase subunit B
MKGLRKLLDSTAKPIFDKGGKLEKYWPVYDALETFLFVPNHTTGKSGSQIRDGIDMKRTMFMVILAMHPVLLFGMWNLGHQHFMAIGETAELLDKFLFGLFKTLPLIIVSYGVGLAIEFVFCIRNSHPINEGFLVSGMLIPLIMPVDVPLWMVGVATAFAVLIGKEVFGGTGMNILNVALTARAFLFFAYPTKMSGNGVWINTADKAPVDGFTGETFLAQAIERGDNFYNAAGQTYASSSESFIEAFIGTIPGSIGETSALACLLGAFVLIFTGVGSWRIMLSALAGGAFMGLIFNWAGENYFTENLFLQVPFYTHLVLGGFMFGVVFMATDPVTATQTNVGKWIYGFLIGVLAILIRVANPAYPEGMMLAILFMNVMAPLIDHYVVQANVKRRLKRLKTA